VSTNAPERSPDALPPVAAISSGDLDASPASESSSASESSPTDKYSPAPVESFSPTDESSSPTEQTPLTLAALPLGAHLILRCRKDWRDATVVAHAPDCVTLSVGSPKGRTYRVRRTPDAALFLDGSIPILGESKTLSWRCGLARYDVRW
jgi:hypothetical protein